MLLKLKNDWRSEHDKKHNNLLTKNEDNLDGSAAAFAIEAEEGWLKNYINKIITAAALQLKNEEHEKLERKNQDVAAAFAQNIIANAVLKFKNDCRSDHGKDPENPGGSAAAFAIEAEQGQEAIRAKKTKSELDASGKSSAAFNIKNNKEGIEKIMLSDDLNFQEMISIGSSHDDEGATSNKKHKKNGWLRQVIKILKTAFCCCGSKCD